MAAGLIALIRDRQITLRNGLGQTYGGPTVLTCLTGFGIFEHGGFGKPHVLGIITLVVLGIAALAAGTQIFGRASKCVEVVAARRPSCST